MDVFAEGSEGDLSELMFHNGETVVSVFYNEESEDIGYLECKFKEVLSPYGKEVDSGRENKARYVEVPEWSKGRRVDVA